MKTRDLIAALQEADPTGKEEVSVGNIDIHFVGREPAYYDGCLQVLTRDEALKNCFNITGATIRGDGNKVVIHTYSVRDLLSDMPGAPVLYDGTYSEKHYAERIAGWRKEGRDLEAEVRASRDTPADQKEAAASQAKPHTNPILTSGERDDDGREGT